MAVNILLDQLWTEFALSVVWASNEMLRWKDAETRSVEMIRKKLDEFY